MSRAYKNQFTCFFHMRIPRPLKSCGRGELCKHRLWEPLKAYKPVVAVNIHSLFNLYKIQCQHRSVESSLNQLQQAQFSRPHFYKFHRYVWIPCEQPNSVGIWFSAQRHFTLVNTFSVHGGLTRGWFYSIALYTPFHRSAPGCSYVPERHAQCGVWRI